MDPNGLEQPAQGSARLDGELAELSERGFVILRSVLSASEITELRTGLAVHERDRPMGRNTFEGQRTQRVYSLAAKGAAFMRLAEHPRVMAIADRVLLPNFLLSTMQSIRLHPGEPGQPWHSDDIFYKIARPRPVLALSTIWAIEEFTADNGATRLIPGSHRWGAEHPDERPHEEVAAVMPAGSVVVFDGALWHQGAQNRSAGTRLAISPQYCQPWLRPQESQLLICPPAIAAGFSSRGRTLVGYSIHPPFIGQVDGMHPLRLIDPSYHSDQRTKKTEAAELADRYLYRPTN